MATKIDELKAVLTEVNEQNVDTKIADAETRLKLLREVKRMLGIGTTPKPRTKKGAAGGKSE
jgi:hypothetical protein